MHIITVIGNIFWQDFNCINIHYTYSAYAKYQSLQITVIRILWYKKNTGSWNKKQGKMNQKCKEKDTGFEIHISQFVC